LNLGKSLYCLLHGAALLEFDKGELLDLLGARIVGQGDVCYRSVAAEHLLKPIMGGIGGQSLYIQGFIVDIALIRELGPALHL